MTVDLLWMRHGTCDDGLCRPGAHARPASPLSILGAVEAGVVARELRDHRWRPALVVSSPLRRAQQTAAIVARVLRASLADPIDTFTEWRAPRCVLGRPPRQYPAEYLAWRNHRERDPDRALPGGESLRAFARRAAEAAAAADDLAAEHGAVLVVSHRLLIGAVTAQRRGCADPVDVFRAASSFRLNPARLWATPLQE